MFLTLLKRLVLVLKFNFLFPKSLDILKKQNENASLSSKMVLNEKIKPFLVLILLFLTKKGFGSYFVLVLIKKAYGALSLR